MKNTTKQHLQSLITAGVIVMVHSAGALAGDGVPPELQVPAGNVEYLKVNASGTQNYICLPSGWTFLGPQATLFVKYRWLNGENKQQVATHFLSANPDEGGTLHPTWQSSVDTSAVWAKAIANSSDPKYAKAGAIPWLLLQVTGSQRGPMGGAMLVQTTYLQRVNTSGGVKPAEGCAGETVGAIAMVPYTTDYVFYKSEK